MQILSLHRYPVKSGRVIDVAASAIDHLGLEYDRRWVVVQDIAGEDGALVKRFISQRTHPQLARLIIIPSKDRLHFSYDGAEYKLDLKARTVMRSISVWGDNFPAPIYQDPVNDWLSQKLGGQFELAGLSGSKRQRQEAEFRDAAFNVSFADSYPVLLASKGSLQELNNYVRTQGENALPMSRFRPNIVIEGTKPWAEDGWKRIKIGDVVLECVKPCTRCIVTTLDPMSGDSRGDISLRALTHLRRSADKRLKGVLFGMNAIPLNAGHIKQGDKVEVLETQEPWPIH